jgi:hypothetical protein
MHFLHTDEFLCHATLMSTGCDAVGAWKQHVCTMYTYVITEINLLCLHACTCCHQATASNRPPAVGAVKSINIHSGCDATCITCSCRCSSSLPLPSSSNRFWCPANQCAPACVASAVAACNGGNYSVTVNGQAATSRMATPPNTQQRLLNITVPDTGKCAGAQNHLQLHAGDACMLHE